MLRAHERGKRGELFVARRAAGPDSEGTTDNDRHRMTHGTERVLARTSTRAP